MSGPLTPVITLGVVSYANNWYNTGNATDVKPLLFAGIAGLLLEGFASIPGMEPTATAIGWLALVGMFLSNAQTPSPADNLIKLTGGKLHERYNFHCSCHCRLGSRGDTGSQWS